MALNDAALVVAANAVDGVISHMQAHSGAPGAAGTTNAIGTRVAVNGTVDADGDITWTGVAFTGLPASTPFWGVTYWSAATGGTFYGQMQTTGGAGNDTTANAAGAITVNVTETGTAA